MGKKIKKPVSFLELNDTLNKFSPDGDILEDSVYARIDEFIPTGPYILNAALSGSLFGGMPNRRSLTFAGEEGTGKTYLALSIARNAQAMGYSIIYYDTEGGIDIDFVKRLGVDTRKVRIENINTIEQFATLTAKLNETLFNMKEKGEEPPKIMVILDSLGNLSSTKEKADTTSGSGKRDMTKQQAIRRTFRVVGNDFAKNAVPFIICNHVYAAIGSFFPHNEVSGGGGIKYNSSIIMMLTKSKLTDKESEQFVIKKGLDKHTKIGIVVTVTPIKQRFARPIKVQIHIPFYKKPNPFVGLEKFVSWENCGIIRGKALNEKDYEKLSEKDKKGCFEFKVTEEHDVTSTKDYKKLSPEERLTIYEKDDKKFIEKIIEKFALPKETARTLVCRHEGGEVPLSELYTERIFTNEVLKELDEKIIKPTFMLPSIESLEDLAEVTADLENMEMDESEQ
jgi:RecA/RadA recombinase